MKKLEKRNNNIIEIEKFATVCSCNCSSCSGCTDIFDAASNADVKVGSNNYSFANRNLTPYSI